MSNRNRRADRRAERIQQASSGGAIIDPRQKVLVSCTTQGSMRKETARALATVLQAAGQKYRMELALVEGKPYESVLNEIAHQAQKGEFDWWLHTDDDQSWNSDPLNAIGAMKDVVVFPTPVFRPGGTTDLGAVFGFNTFRLAQEVDLGYVDSDEHGDRFSLFVAQKGMHRVDMFGTGSFLIRVPVLEKLKQWLHAQATPRGMSFSEKCGPFSRVFDDRGVQVEGNDVAFCRRCREAGIELWADFDCVCSHWHELDMLQLMGMMKRQRNDVLEKLHRQMGMKHPSDFSAPGVGELKQLELPPGLKSQAEAGNPQSSEPGGEVPNKGGKIEAGGDPSMDVGRGEGVGGVILP